MAPCPYPLSLPYAPSLYLPRPRGRRCAGFKTGLCAAKTLNRPDSLLALSNNTSIVPTLAAAHARFMALYRVRAHIHHYTQYMELADIAEAASSLTNVISAYNELEVDEEDGGGDD